MHKQKLLVRNFIAFSLLFSVCFIGPQTRAGGPEGNTVENNWDGEKYHRNSGQQQDAAEKILSGLSFNGNEAVIDIGCGSGQVTSKLRSQFFKEGSVLGIDYCSSMIEKAKNEYQIPGLNFKVLDATQIEFHEQFDLATSFNCFHWIKDMQTAVTRIAKSLKPGGTLVAVFSIDSPIEPSLGGMKVIRELMQSARWGKYFASSETDWNNFGTQDYLEFLNNSGLEGDIKFQTLPDWIFPNREKFIEYLAMIPLNATIPTELKNEFLEDFVDRYTEIHPKNDENGTYRFHRREAILIAKKR
jgi:trans-aconitate methyltransferase